MSQLIRYRKRPVVVEAIRFDPADGYDLAEWCGGRFITEAKPSDPSDVAYRLLIPTLDGTVVAEAGDWIVRDAQGFHPCRPDVFAGTYEPEIDETQYLGGIPHAR